MKLKKIGERTYYIDGLFKIGVFVIDTNDEYSDVCLIETGVDAKYAQSADEVLEKARFRVALIINTHYHADHSGGNAYFVNKYKCPSYTEKTNAALISNYDICPSIIWGGRPVSDVLNNYFYATPSETEDIANFVLPNGLEIKHLPGHSIDMIAVKTEDDVYFVGDAVVGEETIRDHKLIYLFDVKKTIESLEEISTWKGKWFVPYHASPVTQIYELAQKNLEVIHNNMKMIKDICKKPKSMDDIVKEVFDRYGYRLTMYKYAVEGGVVRTYVTYLYNIGELEYICEDNYIKWKTK